MLSTPLLLCLRWGYCYLCMHATPCLSLCSVAIICLWTFLLTLISTNRERKRQSNLQHGLLEGGPKCEICHSVAADWPSSIIHNCLARYTVHRMVIISFQAPHWVLIKLSGADLIQDEGYLSRATQKWRFLEHEVAQQQGERNLFLSFGTLFSRNAPWSMATCFSVAYTRRYHLCLSVCCWSIYPVHNENIFYPTRLLKPCHFSMVDRSIDIER